MPPPYVFTLRLGYDILTRIHINTYLVSIALTNYPTSLPSLYFLFVLCQSTQPLLPVCLLPEYPASTSCLTSARVPSLYCLLVLCQSTQPLLPACPLPEYPASTSCLSSGRVPSLYFLFVLNHITQPLLPVCLLCLRTAPVLERDHKSRLSAHPSAW